MVTVAFALVSAMSGLMGMNLYFAVTTFPLVSSTVQCKNWGVVACLAMLHKLHTVPVPLVALCLDLLPKLGLAGQQNVIIAIMCSTYSVAFGLSAPSSYFHILPSYPCMCYTLLTSAAW